MHVQAAGKELMDMLCKDDCLFYVCGDGAHMAKDVRTTVIQLLQVCVSHTHTHTHTHARARVCVIFALYDVCVREGERKRTCEKLKF
jgi:hypothetical protein